MMPGEQAPARGAPRAPNRVSVGEGSRQRSGKDSPGSGRTNMPRERRGALVRQEEGFPAPRERAHRELEGFSGKQPDQVKELLRGGASPLQRTAPLGALFFSARSGRTHRTSHWYRSVCWLESPGEPSSLPLQNPTPHAPQLGLPLTVSRCTPAASGRGSSELQTARRWPPARCPSPARAQALEPCSRDAGSPAGSWRSVSVCLSQASGLGFAGQRKPNSGRRNSH